MLPWLSRIDKSIDKVSKQPLKHGGAGHHESESQVPHQDAYNAVSPKTDFKSGTEPPTRRIEMIRI